MTSLFVTIFFSKSLWASRSLKYSYQRMYLSKISIICSLWYEFKRNLDAQSDFDKNIVTKKLVKSNYSYLKYALVIIQRDLLWCLKWNLGKNTIESGEKIVKRPLGISAISEMNVKDRKFNILTLVLSRCFWHWKARVLWQKSQYLFNLFDST